MSVYRPREELDGVVLIQDPYEVDALDREEGAGRAKFFCLTDRHPL